MTKTPIRLLWLCVLLPAMVSAQTYFPDPESEGGWRKNTDPLFVRERGLDPEQLRQLGEYSQSIPNAGIPGYDYGKYKATLVIKDGWIVGEWYDQPDGSTYRNYVSSIGKTFALAAFGVLVRDAELNRLAYDIDAGSRVYDQRWLGVGFPLTDPRKAQITFDQIFSHTSGLCPQRVPGGRIIEQGRDRWTDYEAWVVGHDPRWPQTSPLYYPPGEIGVYPHREQWGAAQGAYSSVGFAHLGLVIRNIGRMPAAEFLWRRILEPIGFSGIDYHNPPSPPEIKWFTAGGLRMTARDLARFAYLVMNQGVWGDREIVSRGWFQRFLAKPDYPNLRSNVDGYFGAEYPRDMFRLFGSGGNYVFVLPSHGLIVLKSARTSKIYRQLIQRDLLKRILLTIRPDPSG